VTTQLQLINIIIIIIIIIIKCHKERGSVLNGQAANICESATLPRRGWYLQVARTWQVHQSWELQTASACASNW